MSQFDTFSDKYPFICWYFLDFLGIFFMQLEADLYVQSSFSKSSEYFQQCNLTFVKNILSRHTVPSFKQFSETTARLNEQVC